MRIPIQLSEDSAEPMYHQIEVQLRSLILSGSLPTGTLLPSIREFAHDLSCSIITIRRVYQDLENEGLLRTKQGTGTFVASVGESERERYRSGAVAEAFRAAIETAMRVHMTRAETDKLFHECLDTMMPDDQGGEQK
ncbi:GntR family transcriptional regulator [Paenibacillus ginsengarvi]|uniref:GntR family transcriptional regulator n=1 Tax=Paenibacillus ginsengarvi TaxID=400777 RepID=A0A3B0AM57_9BACL|nr:GntR family transcriptional regulator [Paenibacillus ginsengarvi]RKN61401.1 GntR family transcriptional regulator [Paenibacillus ginsengarvi]